MEFPAHSFSAHPSQDGRCRGDTSHGDNICVRLIQDGANGLTVSPDGGYVNVRSKGNPLIVGREYHNDGTGPARLAQSRRSAMTDPLLPPVQGDERFTSSFLALRR